MLNISSSLNKEIIIIIIIIIYCGFIQLILKTSQTVKTAQCASAEFLHCRDLVITINQKLNEPYGINHTVQRNNRFNILCLLNCLPCNQAYSNSLPLCYLYVSMIFSSLIHGSYPQSTGLIQLIYCLLHTSLLCLWDLQYKP